MNNISAFRLGNYALFDGELQKIVTQTGLDNSAFLEPLPITEEIFVQLGYKPLRPSSDYSVYRFNISEEDGIKVIFNFKQEFLIIEQVSGIEYPFIKWVHELQNVVEDKTLELSGSLSKAGSERIEITVK
jgi:hypothetical protein